jgi:hypothetical protein
MKRLIKSIFHRQKLRKLQICPKHMGTNEEGQKIIPINQAVPYSTDYC